MKEDGVQRVITAPDWCQASQGSLTGSSQVEYVEILMVAAIVQEKPRRGNQVPVTMRAIVQRINRKLAAEGYRRLKQKRGRPWVYGFRRKGVLPT